MIQSLSKALLGPHRAALEKVLWTRGDGFSYELRVAQPDEAPTILTTDQLGEVGEMVACHQVCEHCGKPFSRATRNEADPATGCSNPVSGFHAFVAPVTAHLFLWTGEPVDSWEDTLFGPGPWEFTSMGGESPLTAVVLVGGYKQTGLDEETDTPFEYILSPTLRQVDEAAQALAAANVQFIVPGDPERSVLHV